MGLYNIWSSASGFFHLEYCFEAHSDCSGSCILFIPNTHTMVCLYHICSPAGGHSHFNGKTDTLDQLPR